MNVKTRKISLLLTAFLLFSGFFFTTCELPLGMGDQIDFEPPVLTIYPPQPNPKYVRDGAVITGFVRDNVSVDRVIMREALTGNELFTAVLSGSLTSGEFGTIWQGSWSFELKFTEEQNGEKIAVEIVAFDKVGNSGDTSISALTLIIDTGPPLVEDIWITRTPLRTATLEKYIELFDLEEKDKQGHRSGNANRYQNGAFYINAKLNEKETRIERINLLLYDARDPLNPLPLETEKDPETSMFAPRWLMEENKIIEAGETLWPGYRDEYYSDNERKYYRVVIEAYDRSENGSETLIVNELDYFCLWQKADLPKGILDAVIGSIVIKGSTLPVEFFDDDSLEKAYAVLFKKEQWDGFKSDDLGNLIPGSPAFLNNSNLQIPTNFTDEEKSEWLKDRILEGTVILDWDGKQVEELLKGKSVNEKIIYLQTGNDPSDYGDYRLFTIAQDKKLAPHPENTDGYPDTFKNRIVCDSWNIVVIDDNEPLIVFDTVDITDGHPIGHVGYDIISGASTGNSPEENTFPKLENGQYFEINGYTLREDSTNSNLVTKFRMAWIPYSINSEGPDEMIPIVQEELKKEVFSSGVRDNIHYWDLPLVTGTAEEIGDSGTRTIFRKQVFRKKFDILGSSNDAQTGSPHFSYNGQIENNTKLFIFFAQDNMGHNVFRQLRLLGNTKPPDLAVYDITSRNISFSPLPPKLSDFDSNSNGEISSDERENYETALKNYQQGAHTSISNSINLNPVSEDDRTVSVQYYPRGTIIKYWVNAERSGDLNIASITMEDITHSIPKETGFYNSTTRKLSYVEELPEVTQRVFRFTARDTLKNEVRIQRTAVITNAAMLQNITAIQADGEYGIDKVIQIDANFSSPVYWTNYSSTHKPTMYIRLTRNNNSIVVPLETITPKDTASLSLRFEYTVQQGDSGTIETLFPGITGAGTNDQKEPITLPGYHFGPEHNNCVHINDNERRDSAFIPGYNQSGFEWNAANEESLQKRKTITLKGSRPSVTGFTLNTKDPYTGTQNRYLTVNDVLGFTLTATTSPSIDQIYTEAVAANGVPRIRFQIVPDGQSTAAAGYYYADWRRNVTGNGMYFSYTVTSTMPNGEIVNLYLDQSQGKIVDRVGNSLEIPSAFTNLAFGGTTKVYVDRTSPQAPPTTLGGTTIGATPDTVRSFNSNNIELAILFNASPPPYATGEYHELIREYSTDNGLNWTNYTAPVPSIPGGMYVIQTRYRDRAGNVGAVTRQLVHVNAKFPELKSITVDKVNGYYVPGTNGTLTFSLAFEEPVYINTAANVTMTLKDRTANPVHNIGGTTNSHEITLQAVASGNPTSTSLSNTIRITWTLAANTKEMLNGLYVSAVSFTGLRDQFTNSGMSGTASSHTADLSIANTGGTSPYTCKNLSGDKLFIDTIAPRVNSITPVNANGAAGNVANTVMGADNSTITITFNEKVIKGSGTILIKPRAGFAVPPVMENEGYYIDQAGTRYSDNADGRTYVVGFSDVYNSGLSAAQRNYLTLGTTVASAGAAPTASVRPSSVTDTTNPSLSRLVLNERTGQSSGPYMKMPHGLRDGSGWTGSYNSATAAEPAPAANLMVPDTITKWVLDYQYLIHDTAGAVANIRTALEAAKFRQQEIEVGSSNVTIADTAATSTVAAYSTVTIKLSQPLLKGLQWELTYPAATFTDLAGQNAPAVPGAVSTPTNEYWFRSYGVQDPVVRVNRKSSDARTSNWHVPTGRAYNEPAATSTAAGWGMNDFNRAYYRIETETKDARIYYNTFEGTIANGGSVTGAWSGTVAGSNSGANILVNTPDITLYVVEQATASANNTYRTVTTSGGTTAVNHNLGANGTVVQVTVSGTPYWVNVQSANTIRIYETEALAIAGNAGFEMGTGGLNNANFTMIIPGGPAGWQDAFSATAGEWVMKNLVRRRGSSSYIVSDNGYDVTRTITANHRGLRSYNRDILKTDLLPTSFNVTSPSGTQITSGAENYFTYEKLQASKNYVTAFARVDNSGAGTFTSTNAADNSQRGYEGVFRSVIALNQASFGGNLNGASNTNNPIMIQGSNIKNGMPSIAGFPVRDAEETGDNRFIKLYFRDSFTGTNATMTSGQFYWVSYEILSLWYALNCGRRASDNGNTGGTHMGHGDVNNYLLSSYGELTYSNNQQ